MTSKATILALAEDMPTVNINTVDLETGTILQVIDTNMFSVYILNDNKQWVFMYSKPIEQNKQQTMLPFIIRLHKDPTYLIIAIIVICLMMCLR